MDNASAPAASAQTKSETIDLAEPIIRGETAIEKLIIRKPKAGELRGLSIQELMSSSIAATLDILPRITIPPISQAEAENMALEDVAICAGEIVGFFLTAKDRVKIEEASKR